MPDELTPAYLPDTINKRREAITLYAVAVVALSAVALVGILGALVLAWQDRAVPEGVIVLASVAVGALAALVTGNKAQ